MFVFSIAKNEKRPYGSDYHVDVVNVISRFPLFEEEDAAKRFCKRANRNSGEYYVLPMEIIKREVPLSFEEKQRVEYG